MSTVKPFRGLRPVVENAVQVASPPYDVLNSAEAREMARDNTLSFLHVVKPEIDLDPSTNLYSDEVYAKGAENLARLRDTGTLLQDEKPCLYVYEQKMRIGEKDHVQVGLVAGASIDEYQNDLIKKHELTRPDKEKDRTRHVETLNANTGPVFLLYKSVPRIEEIIAKVCRTVPTYDFVADDGIGHRFWVVADDETNQALIDAFAAVPHLYVADGHHRSASASAVREIRKDANPNHTGNEEYNFFLTVIFPHDQMYIMDYNRVVFDLGNLTEEEFLKKIKDKFEVEKTQIPKPEKATQFGMYLGGSWYRLQAKAGTFDADDPVSSLDVAILQNNLLSPILGIEDPRRDKRIDFIGGIRGTIELERRVNEDAVVAFAMYATSIEQLMAIADAGEIMPPKSTWFEPKLRSGLIVRPLE
ncbi:MAG: DUF1015 domain-containing protein [Proteobacteria bacterium]|nr:DUF1015 domain-containing protein [Pseudomonadota bacterium]